MKPELSLIVLRSADVDAARRFYEAIGLTWQEEQHGDGPRHHSARLGDILFELYPTRESAHGRVRLAFRVADPIQAADAAVAVGGRRITGKRQSEGVVVEDPDGNQVELFPAPARTAPGPAARPTYEAVIEFVRNYASRPEDPPPFDLNGVIHLMLAALDNLGKHWLDADLAQLAASATAEQRDRLIQIGAFLREYQPEEEEDDDG